MPAKKQPPMGKRFVSGQQPDGRRFGAAHQPRGRAWSQEEIARLGTATDDALGRVLDRSRLSVYLKRRELGIAAYTAPGRPAKTVRAAGESADLAQGGESDFQLRNFP